MLTYRKALDAHGGTAALLASARQLRDFVLNDVHASVDVAARQLEHT